MHSVTRWLDYFFIFGHFQQRKFAKKHKHFANLSTKFCQIPNYARKEFQKYFNTLANVAIFRQIWSHWFMQQSQIRQSGPEHKSVSAVAAARGSSCSRRRCPMHACASVFKLSPKSSHPSTVLTDLYHKGGRTAKEKHKLFKFLSPIFVAVNSFSKTA